MSAEEDLELIDAIIYGDAFDCAVTFDEIWRYSRVRATRAQMLECLGRLTLRNLIGERGGLYFLAGREPLADRRNERRNRAQRLRKRARNVSRFLQHAPFVRGILLTGSVAADDAEKDADVDILVIVAEGRIALAFLVLAPLSRVVSRRIFCPNYYLSQSHLSVPRHDRYVARELLQAQPLTHRADALLAANPWAQEQLPNACPTTHPLQLSPGGTILQRILEFPFGRRLGAVCEQKARRIVTSRLLAHYGSFLVQVPDDVQQRFELGIELRFHGAPRVNHCLERYQRTRAELARRLEEASQSMKARLASDQFNSTSEELSKDLKTIARTTG